MSSENARRGDRELIDATRPYAEEDPKRSLWALVSTLVAWQALAFFAISGAPLAARVAASVGLGFVIVRAFCLYHDYLHGSIFKRARWAKPIFYAIGTFVLTPPSVWRATHNYHHAHTAKIVGSHIGSFPVLTVDMYQRATTMQRFAYRVTRHPLTVLLAYFLLFFYGMCIAPYRRNARKHRDAVVVLAIHVALTIVLWDLFGFETYFLTMGLPLLVACAAGAYLFYAQHNFPGMYLAPRESWTFAGAALDSSSYLRTGPILRWLTANIGLHHVHHLNPGIPFYRLPEAMREIPELSTPHETSLSPREIWRCFHGNLWDPARREMVPYPRS